MITKEEIVKILHESCYYVDSSLGNMIGEDKFPSIVDSIMKKLNQTIADNSSCNSMIWISVDDETKAPPFDRQVLVSCGHGKFFGWLRKIELTSNGREMIWDKQCPKEFDDYKPTHWMEIKEP
jgi:hypothetical protein